MFTTIIKYDKIKQMIEKERRIIIFGDFTKIDHDSLEDIDDIRTKNEFELESITNTNLTVDVAPSNSNVKQEQTTFPIFKNKNSSTTVFFEKNSIVYQELNSSIESYDDFLERATTFVVAVVERFNLQVTRVACNGSFADADEAYAKKLYTKVFDSNLKLGSATSDEWRAFINKKEDDDEVGCLINKNIDIMRGVDIIGPDNIPVGPAVLIYDFNTYHDDMKPLAFDVDRIKKFLSKAKSYRAEVINL